VCILEIKLSKYHWVSHLKIKRKKYFGSLIIKFLLSILYTCYVVCYINKTLCNDIYYIKSKS